MILESCSRRLKFFEFSWVQEIVPKRDRRIEMVFGTARVRATLYKSGLLFLSTSSLYSYSSSSSPHPLFLFYHNTAVFSSETVEVFDDPDGA